MPCSKSANAESVALALQKPHHRYGQAPCSRGWAFLKLDEDSFSSDSEDRLMLRLQPSDAMPLIASGKLSKLCSMMPQMTIHLSRMQ